ncbi:MAG TPA: DinB family protein [Candidatus Acidoferrales bacterium]|nr:DinB family protein [Candidatus Acidoferrales bacterium]
MKKFTLSVLALAFFALIAGAPVASAQAARKSPGPAEALLRVWNGTGREIITMAEDWPASKYNYRPNDQVRTFGQILNHLASSNYYATNAALGKSLKGIENDPKEYKTKAQIVAFVKKSFADGAAALKAGGDAGALAHLEDWVGIIEHSGEHEGNLVTYYRNNGVVPPQSRPKPKK